MAFSRRYSGYQGLSVTTGDYASRLQEMISQPVVIPPLSRLQTRAPREADSDRIDREMASAMKKGDDNLVGYVGNYEGKVNQIVNLIQTDPRNFVEAERLYKDLQSVASDNQAGLDELFGYVDLGGTVTKNIAQSAQSLAQGAYNSKMVTLPDGTSTTLGQLFGGDGYKTNKSREFERYGFAPQVADAYFGDDSDAASAVAQFVDPVLNFSREKIPGAKTIGHPNRLQYNDAAKYVAENFKTMAKLLGAPGANRLIQDVLSTCSTAGGMTYLLRGVTDYARRLKDADSNSIKDGYQFVSDLMTAVNETHQAMFNTGGVPEGERLDIKNAEHRRFTTSAVLSVLKAFGNSLVDFRNPRTRTAMKDAATVFARAERANFNLFDVSKLSGRSPAADIGAYVKSISNGEEPPADNIITTLNSLHTRLNAMVESAPTMAEDVLVSTGDANFYNKNPAASIGRQSVSKSADLMQLDMVGAFEKALVPHMVAGRRVDDALRRIVLDRDQSGKLRENVVGAISRHLRGRGGKALAGYLYDGFIQQALGGEPASKFSIYKAISKVALASDGNALGIPESEWRHAKTAAISWYLSEVAEPARFASQRKAIESFKMTPYGGGLDERQASIAAAYIVRQALEAVEKGDSKTANDILDKGMHYGVYYDYQYYTDEKTGKRRPARMQIYGVPSSMSPNVVVPVYGRVTLTPEFMTRQSQLREEQAQGRKLMNEAIKKSIE